MIRRMTVVALCLLLSACATKALKINQNLEWDGANNKVLLMPLDVQLSELTAGGVTEPKAEWTAKAEKHIKTAMDEILRTDLSAKLVEADDWVRDEDLPVQLVKLHQAVGVSILLHAYAPQFKLPNKGDTFDWSLGIDTQALKKRYGADYALFVFVRDSYASAGRAAVIVFGALLGVGIPGGQQVGFASLVDLDTGDIVWFNRLARAGGDLRSEKPAMETVKLLLDGLPK